MNIVGTRENIVIKYDEYISLRKKAWQDFFVCVVGRDVLKREYVVI